MKCNHKPDISFIKVLFVQKKSLQCLYCKRNVEPTFSCHLIAFLLFILLIICGIIVLIVVRNRNILPFLAITEAVLFWALESILYKWGPYKLIDE